MGKIRVAVQNLQSNNIDVERLAAIAEDVGKYHIFGLQFGVDKFIMRSIKKKSAVYKDNVELTFSNKDLADGSHRIDSEMVVRFMKRSIYYTIIVKMHADARYDYLPYESKLHDYLYSYSAGLVENHPMIRRIEELELPRSLQTFYPNVDYPTFVRMTEDHLHWVDTRSFFEVSRLEEKKEIPRILSPEFSHEGIHTIDAKKQENKIQNAEDPVNSDHTSSKIDSELFEEHVSDFRERERRYHETMGFVTK